MNEDKIPIYFDPQVLDAARNFLEGAERCWERRDGSGCVYAAMHCAVLACELFLKSMMATEVWIDEDTDPPTKTFNPESGKIYLVTSIPTKSDEWGSDASPDNKKLQANVHNGLIEFVRHDLRERLDQEFCDGEIAWLNSLKTPLMASRYPFEPDAGVHLDYSRAIEIARKLGRFCDALQPQWTPPKA